MSSSLESLAVKSSRVSSHSAKFESSRESPKKVTRVRLESLPVTRVNNSANLTELTSCYTRAKLKHSSIARSEDKSVLFVEIDS